jgi:hypothetical protein
MAPAVVSMVLLGIDLEQEVSYCFLQDKRPAVILFALTGIHHNSLQSKLATNPTITFIIIFF